MKKDYLRLLPLEFNAPQLSRGLFERELEILGNFFIATQPE
jgi:hypothetical protein